MASSLGALAGLKAFTRLSGAERRAAVHAFAAIVYWRVVLWLWPWRRVSQRMERAVPADVPPRAEWPPMVKRAVARASRVSPAPTCLVQALAGATLLRRGGFAATICIGVKRGEDRRVAAHAWLDCGGTVITGEIEALGAYQELVRLSGAPRPPKAS